jgi:hypothetical protein
VPSRQLFSTYVLAKKALSYEKGARKMLMKLKHGKSALKTQRIAENACGNGSVNAALADIWLNGLRKFMSVSVRA